MQRREFLAAAGGGAALLAHSSVLGQNHAAHQAAGRIYMSPKEAMASPREELAYVVATYAGTKVQQLDFLATVDLDPASGSYGKVVHRLPMPSAGDRSEERRVGKESRARWGRGR